jgi:hypothetical protein
VATHRIVYAGPTTRVRARNLAQLLRWGSLITAIGCVYRADHAPLPYAPQQCVRALLSVPGAASLGDPRFNWGRQRLTTRSSLAS